MDSKEMNDIKWIYQNMSDELSRQLFSLRFLYNITQDVSYISKIVSLSIENRIKENDPVYLFCRRAALDAGGVVVYGVGALAKSIKKYLTYIEVPIICYCDAYKYNQDYLGERVISPKELVTSNKKSYVLICVANMLIRDEIYQNLSNMGIDKTRLMYASDYLGKQYFDNTIPMTRDGAGLFVDAGSYDLTTSLEYLAWSMNENKHIVAFEPEHDCFEKCRAFLKQFQGNEIELYQEGIWNSHSFLNFQTKSGGASMLNNNILGNEVEVVAIDDVLGDRKVDFIKMDIEGAEYEALCGAKSVIELNHPKLAISVYHKPEDIVMIPELILTMCSSYKLFLRHYTTEQFDTVLYAI